MLKKEQLSKIASLLKIKEDELESAIKADTETDITIPELNVFTTEELTKRDENKTRESYKQGKEAGVEMIIKDQREKLGLDFEGKDIEKLLEAYEKKIKEDSKIEPNKKVEELSKIVENLKSNLATAENEKKELASKISEVSLTSTLKGYLPQNRLDVLSDDEFISAVRREYSFVEEDGKLVVKKGNDIVRDAKTQDPLEPKDVISGYFSQRKWVKEEEPGKQGRGAGNKGPQGGYLKLSDLKAQFEKEGKSLNGSEFQTAMQEALKANPNLDLDS